MWLDKNLQEKSLPGAGDDDETVTMNFTYDIIQIMISTIIKKKLY